MAEESYGHAMGGSLVYIVRMRNPEFCAAMVSCSSLVCSDFYTSLLLIMSYFLEKSLSIALQTPLHFFRGRFGLQDDYTGYKMISVGRLYCISSPFLPSLDSLKA